MKVIALLFINFVSNVLTGVVELTDRDFDLRLKGKNAMVMFYSPNCGHCQRMKPTYESLAAQRSIINSGVMIAKVDCTDAGKKTCGKYGVNGFPTVKFVSRVESREAVTEYDGDRQLDDLSSFVLNNNRPAFVEVSDKEIKSFVDSSKLPVVVGFFKDAKSSLYTKLTSIAPEQKLNFLIGVSFSEKAAKDLGQSLESVVIFRQKQYQSKLEENTISCTSDKELSSCLKKNRFSIVEYRDKKNHDSFKTPMITAFIGIDPLMQRSDAKRLRIIMVKSALKFKDITFTISKKSEFDSFVADIAPSMKDRDIYLLAVDRDDNKYVGQSVGSVDDPKAFEGILDQFIQDFKKGNVLERFVKSQPKDTPDDGNVRVVVGHTFDEIVMDNDKDVLIEFYAPWCGHCKKLAPIYQQLATLLKDESNLVIAKYDATANEAQKYFGVEGFPTIYLAKAGKKTSPISYSGKRETKDMLEWLRKNTKHAISFDGEVPEIKEEL